jgi:hypothetical protein
MNAYDLFFVAFFKHDAPQHLVAGPFLDKDIADSYVDTFGEKNHCVVKTSLTMELA